MILRGASVLGSAHLIDNPMLNSEVVRRDGANRMPAR
jgi:hypothetical protein